MSKRDNSLLILDMLESARKISAYTQGMSFEVFKLDDRTVDAVIRNFEVIGEAANRVSHDYKSINSNIEWDKLRGFRNRIIHEYFGVDLEIVWQIIEDDLDILIRLLEEKMN